MKPHGPSWTCLGHQLGAFAVPCAHCPRHTHASVILREMNHPPLTRDDTSPDTTSDMVAPHDLTQRMSRSTTTTAVAHLDKTHPHADHNWDGRRETLDSWFTEFETTLSNISLTLSSISAELHVASLRDPLLDPTLSTVLPHTSHPHEHSSPRVDIAFGIATRSRSASHA